MKAPAKSSAEQVQECSNALVLTCLIDAESRSRTKWARGVLPLLREEVDVRGLDVQQGRRLVRLREQARAADQRGHAAYDHQGPAGSSTIGAAVSQAQRLWAEAAALEAEINNA